MMHTGQVVRQLAGVLPRSADALTGSAAWDGLSVAGVRQFGEVALDELVLTAMTLSGPGPRLRRPVSTCAAAAEEFAGHTPAELHAPPNPLQIRRIQRQWVAGLAYERITYDHDPMLPSALTADGLGGPATAGVHLCRHRDGPRPWLVWVHGAGQGGASDFLFARARRLHQRLGFNLAMPVQPGHGVRRNVWPPYPDMDPLTNVAGMMRAVSEVRAVVRWLEPQSTVIAVSGLSLGSAVAALVSHLEDAAAAVALYTPILGLNAMIGQHISRWGRSGDELAAALGSDVVAELTKVIDPLSVLPAAPPERRLIVAAWQDRMAMRGPALALHERWGGRVHWHDGGHVGHLFSGRVQRVTEEFLGEVRDSAGQSPAPYSATMRDSR